MESNIVKNSEELRLERNEAIRLAQKLAHEYACQCEVGEERIRAFEIHETLRNVGRFY